MDSIEARGRPAVAGGDARDTRTRLLDAAKELIWQRGVSATSPAMLIRRSGVGQGSLYHFYGSKREWALDAITALAAELTAETDDVLAGERPGLEKIDDYLRRPRSALLGCRLGRLAFDPDVIADDRLRAPIAGYFAHLHELLADALRQAVAERQLSGSLDVEAVAAAMASVVQGGFVTARATDDRGAVRKATDGLRALLPAAGVGSSSTAGSPSRHRGARSTGASARRKKSS